MTARARRSRQRACCVIGLVMLAACSATAPSRFYTLSSVKPEPALEAAASDSRRDTNPSTLLVEIVEIPQTLDRPQIVRRSGDNKVEIAEIDRWSEPLDGMIRHMLADDLTTRLPKVRVLTSTPASVPIDRTLMLEIDRFDADAAGMVRLTAQWFVLSADKTIPRVARRSAIELSAGATDTEAVVVAMSSALASLSAEMASALLALSPAPSR